MYRRVVLSAKSPKTGPIDVLYHVRGASVVAQGKNISDYFDPNVPVIVEQVPNIFDNAVRLRVDGAVTIKASFEFILNVSENQPSEESIEETTSTGVSITVYNAHGVVVCRNTPKTPASGAPAQTGGSGEMTTEPIDGPGEMTSEPIDHTGETTSEPIDRTGETV